MDILEPKMSHEMTKSSAEVLQTKFTDLNQNFRLFKFG